MNEIRFIDLFSGIGGFRLGLERANKENWEYLSEEQGRNSLRSIGDSSYARKRSRQQMGRKNIENRREGREERGLLRRQNMYGYRTDADECGRKAPVGHISQESSSGGEIGLERADSATQDQLPGSLCEEGGDIHPARVYGKGNRQYPSNSYRCVWSCDNNRYANQIYTKQFGEDNHFTGDIRGVDPGEIPDFDLLCAGFPCQSFSVAGKRQGFQDTRGTLFFEISRIAEAKRPKMLLLENVKGLLSSDRGQTFKTILQELGRIGYWAEWQIFNSKHHGVPQNRERVFIIGHSRNGCSRPIFPIGKTDEMAEADGRGRPPVQAEVSTAIDGSYYKGVDRHGQRTVVGELRKIGNIAESGHDSIWGRVYDPDGLAMNLNAEGGGIGAKTGLYAILSDNLGGNIKNRVRDADEAPAWTLGGSSTKVAISFTNPHDPEEKRKVNLSDTSRAVKPPYGNQQPLILADRTRNYAGLGRNLESPKEITNALSGVQKDNLLLENWRIRRLTPVECERLQGFPDSWTAQGICKKGDIVWTGKYKVRVEIDEDGFEVTRYHPIMTKAKADGIYPICDTNRYKCLGNAVSVPVITFLGRRIMDSVRVDILDKKAIGAEN